MGPNHLPHQEASRRSQGLVDTFDLVRQDTIHPMQAKGIPAKDKGKGVGERR
jgi:hypothetical protein